MNARKSVLGFFASLLFALSMSGPYLGYSAAASWLPLVPDPRSVDAIVVFAGDDIGYSFYGHQNVEPTAANPAQNWAWWTLAGTQTAVVAATAPNDLHTRPDVAMSRQGYALVVWDEAWAVDSVDCVADPTNPVPQERWQGDIRFRLLNIDPISGSAWAALSTVASGAPDHVLHDPSIAIDSNGKGLAIWVHTQMVRDGNNCIDHLEKRLEYKVWDGAAWGQLGTLPAGGAYTNTVCGPQTTPIPGMVNCQHFTDLTFTARSAQTPATDHTRQQAIAVWHEFIGMADLICTPPPGSGDPFNIPQYIFWPKYAVWDGDSFGAPADVAGGPMQGPAAYSTSPFPQLSKIGISGDQRENAELVFPIIHVTPEPFPTCLTTVEEVWTARWNGGAAGQSWSPAANLVSQRRGIDLAFFQAGGIAPPNPDDKAVAVYHTGWATKAPGGGWVNRVPDIGPDSANPTVAALAHNKVVSVWFDGDLKWAEMDRVNETWGNPAVLGTGFFPEIAALTGSPGLPRAEWTYANYEAGHTLTVHVTQVRDQIESVGSTALVNAISVFDTDTDPAHTRYFFHRLNNRTERRDLGATNMGSSNTLRDYLAWALEQYPADRTILKFDDHGNGWLGTCNDNSPVVGDRLILPELEIGIRQAGLARTGVGGAVHTLNMLVFQACMMGTVEVAYEVRDRANFMVASEDWMDASSAGAGGIRNDHLMNDLTTQPNRTDLELAGQIVQIYQNDNDDQSTYDHTLSALDLAQIGDPGGAADLIDRLAALANAINTNFAGNEAAIRGAVGAAEGLTHSWNGAACNPRARAYPGTAMRDLVSFAQILNNNAALPPAIRNAAGDVMAAAGNAVVANWADDCHRVGDAGGGALQVHGLTIWLERSQPVFNNRTAAYSATAFEIALAALGANNSWDGVVDNIASSSGTYLALTASDPNLFLIAALPEGGSVGDIDTSGKTCGSFCATDLEDAVCIDLGLGREIWLPDHHQINWTIDGALISSTASYTLTIQHFDQNVMADVQVLAGSVSPGAAVTGQTSWTPPKLNFLPIIFK